MSSGLAHLALMGVVAVILAGCGAEPVGLQAPAPHYALDTLTIGVPSPVITLNPVTTVSPEEANFAHFVWAGLLGVNASGRLFPMLAQSVPTQTNGLISPDGRSITFRLKPNLEWSDGHSLTAADVRFGWQVATQRWAILCPATCGVIQDVVVKGRDQVTFRLRRAFSPLLYDLPPVLPEHQIWKGSWHATFLYLYQASTNFLNPKFAVDGPYQVSSANASNFDLTFVRNPYWRILSKPRFAQVKVDYFHGDVALIAAQDSGAVDLSQDYNVLDFYRQILTQQSLSGQHLILAPVEGVEHLEPNLTGRWEQVPGTTNRWVYVNFLSDPRVRAALSLAIDRRALVQDGLRLPPQAERLVSYSPETPGRFDGVAVHGVWDPIRHAFVRSPQVADARRLLDEAGWHLHSDGYRYRRDCKPAAIGCQLDILLVAPRGDFVRFQVDLQLQAMWKRIGVNIDLQNQAWNVGSLIAGFNENGPCVRGWDDLCEFAQLPGVDPQTDFQLEFTSDHIARFKKAPARSDINYPGIRNLLLDRIFSQAPQVYDLKTRAALYRDWQVQVVRNVYWIPLFYRPEIMVSRTIIGNLKPSPAGLEWNPWALAPSGGSTYG